MTLRGFIKAVLWAFLGLSCLLLIVGIAGDPSRKPLPTAEPASPRAAEIVYRGLPALRAPSLHALQALYATCPGLEAIADTAGKISIGAFDAAPYRKRDYGWHTEVYVEIEMAPQTIQVLPIGLRDPAIGNHLWFVLGSGRHPGAEVHWPTTFWLCNLPVDDRLLSGVTRNWIPQNQVAPIPSLAKTLP